MKEYSEECSACFNKAVDVKTEIFSYPADNEQNAIRKIILYRCKEHLDTGVDEMRELTSIKRNTKPIASKDDHQKALKRVEELWGAELNTPDSHELELLVSRIEQYESDLLSDDKSWDGYFNEKPASDFPEKRNQPPEQKRNGLD